MQKKIEGMEEILDILSTVGSVDPAIIEMMYAAFMERFDPILEALPKLGRNLGDDLSPAVAGLIGVVAGIGAGEALQEQAAALMGNKAKVRGAYLRALMESGFERHEAMAIIVSEAAKQPQLPEMMKSVSISKPEPSEKTPAPAPKSAGTRKPSTRRPAKSKSARGQKGGREPE